MADLARHECLPCRVHGDPAPWRFKPSGGAPRAVSVDRRLHLSDWLSIRDAVLAGMASPIYPTT